MAETKERGHRPLEYADDRQNGDASDEHDLLRCGQVQLPDHWKFQVQAVAPHGPLGGERGVPNRPSRPARPATSPLADCRVGVDLLLLAGRWFGLRGVVVFFAAGARAVAARPAVVAVVTAVTLPIVSFRGDAGVFRDTVGHRDHTRARRLEAAAFGPLARSRDATPTPASHSPVGAPGEGTNGQLPGQGAGVVAPGEFGPKPDSGTSVAMTANVSWLSNRLRVGPPRPLLASVVAGDIAGRARTGGGGMSYAVVRTTLSSGLVSGMFVLLGLLAAIPYLAAEGTAIPGPAFASLPRRPRPR